MKKECSPLRICIAGSGGGHVRQLLDLEPVWSQYDCFLVTERTALGESLSKRHRTYFVSHVALGQARLGRSWLMLKSAWQNLVQSARVIRSERPDVVISTGAGAVFFVVLWARLLGAKVIVIESFARFDRPSMFMRLAAPIAHHTVVQSARLGHRWPRAKVFDPLVVLDEPAPREKLPILFATVGATLPFDRLIESVAELKRSGEIPERVIAQVGVGGSRPECLQSVETLTFPEMQAVLKDADLVVCHGGTGSLITALRERCRIVAMPRLFERGEHYDDHQEEIVSAFESRGLVRRARDVEDLRTALIEVRSSTPVGATTKPEALAAWLQSVLERVARSEPESARP